VSTYKNLGSFFFADLVIYSLFHSVHELELQVLRSPTKITHMLVMLLLLVVKMSLCHMLLSVPIRM
jgi:hypothetical protein